MGQRASFEAPQWKQTIRGYVSEIEASGGGNRRHSLGCAVLSRNRVPTNLTTLRPH